MEFREGAGRWQVGSRCFGRGQESVVARQDSYGQSDSRNFFCFSSFLLASVSDFT